ncbi:SPOR domain-containing protein [Sphingomonas humi]|uniref:SPOR domain-containing protein n=1 Tax=Sphingomonas humi TaxID=335630 RepID=A0ABP7RS75_9SPHN
MAAPVERLPWLHDEPQAPAAAAPKRRAGAMWPWYLLLLFLVGAVAAGAWWLGTAREAAPPELPAEESIPIPVTRSDPAEPVTQEPLANVAEPAPVTSATAPSVSRPVMRSPPRRAVRQSDVVPGEQAPTGRSVFPADEPAAAVPDTGPNPVAIANPRPYAGRVIQLGAFPTRAQAEDNWRRITRRYPYLSTKPKMVNSVDVGALGGGPRTRMYRLQLGTSSQAQSVVICQQLERAGHSCVVVY